MSVAGKLKAAFLRAYDLGLPIRCRVPAAIPGRGDDGKRSRRPIPWQRGPTGRSTSATWPMMALTRSILERVRSARWWPARGPFPVPSRWRRDRTQSRSLLDVSELSERSKRVRGREEAVVQDSHRRHLVGISDAKTDHEINRPEQHLSEWCETAVSDPIVKSIDQRLLVNPASLWRSRWP